MQQIGMAAGHILKLRIGLFHDRMQEDCTWRIIPFRWLITMVSFRPLNRATFPFQMGELHGLQMGVILRTYKSWMILLTYAPPFRVLSLDRKRLAEMKPSQAKRLGPVPSEGIHPR